MLDALRPYVTAGIAIAGAGVIAVTPITAPSSPVPQRSIEFSSVQLTAAALPEAIPTLDAQTTVEAWQNLIIYTGAYLSDALVPTVTNPTPILNQLRANQFAYLNYLAIGVTYGTANTLQILSNIPGTFATAAAQLRAGDPEAAILTLWSFVENSVQLVVTPFMASLQIPGAIAQNIANVAAAVPTLALGLGLDTFETVSSTVRTAAASVQNIVDAASSGDPAAVANAIFAAPASIATALLVGDLAEGGDTPGLINGVFKNLVLARQTIAEALGAPPLEAPEDTLTVADASAVNRKVSITGNIAAPTETVHEPAPAPDDASDASSLKADESVSAPKEKPAAAAVDTKTAPRVEATRVNGRTAISNSVRESAKNVGAQIKSATEGITKTAKGLSGKKSTTDKKPRSDSGSAAD